MEKISSGDIKQRSRYLFIAEKLGLGGAVVISVVLGAVFCALLFFYLHATDNLIYLSFGQRGVYAFLESFPYLLVLSFIVVIMVAALLFRRIDTPIIYKKPVRYVTLVLIIFVVFGGAVLTITRITDRIEENSYRGHMTGMFFRPFLRGGFRDPHRGVVGRVVEVGDGVVVLQTPRGLQKVNISGARTLLNQSIEVGMSVIAVGEQRADVFIAERLRIVHEEDIPLIFKGIHRRFDSSNSDTVPQWRMK